MPKRFGGWGWQPASIEGWLLSASVLGALVLPLPWLEDDGPTLWLYVAGVLVSVGVIFAACYFKGTAGGGRREWREYRDMVGVTTATKDGADG